VSSLKKGKDKSIIFSDKIQPAGRKRSVLKQTGGKYLPRNFTLHKCFN
jgi:hypothetical protein